MSHLSVDENTLTKILFRNFFFQATEHEYEKEKLKERIAKLYGGVAIIQVQPMFMLRYLLIY